MIIRNALVHVRHFTQPPMDTVLYAVKSAFDENLLVRQLEVIGENTRGTGKSIGMDEFYAGTMQRAADMFDDADPDLEFAACVAPIHIMGYNVLAVATRNAEGHEWLFSQFLGTTVAPKSLILGLATHIENAVRGRDAMVDVASERDMAKAIALTSSLAAAIESTVESMKNAKQRRHDA